MAGRTPTVLGYIVVFLAALGVAYIVARMQVGNLFDPGRTGSPLFLVLFPPLAAIATFALLFGIVVRRPMGLRFWLTAPVLVATAMALVYALIGASLPIPLAFGIATVVLFGAGLALLY